MALNPFYPEVSHLLMEEISRIVDDARRMMAAAELVDDARRMMAAAEQGYVIVDIVKKGEDSYQDGKTRASTDVKIKTTQGDEVWVPEKDVIARKPNPEDKR